MAAPPALAVCFPPPAGPAAIGARPGSGRFTFKEVPVADLNSFDLVSKVDMQEVKNAVDQALKEIRQRFDFKGSKTELDLKEKESQLVVVSDDEYKLKAVVEIL